MSGHRKKPNRIILTDRFGLRVSCGHYRAMQRLHEALLQAIIDVTGNEAPWIYRSNSAPSLPATDPNGVAGRPLQSDGVSIGQA
jgi:hypothetical protein